MVPNPSNGLLDSTTLGVVSDSYLYNGFGEIEDYDSTISGSTNTAQLSLNYVRDKLGRIIEKTETTGGTPTEFKFVDTSPETRTSTSFIDAC